MKNKYQRKSSYLINFYNRKTVETKLSTVSFTSDDAVLSCLGFRIKGLMGMGMYIRTFINR